MQFNLGVGARRKVSSLYVNSDSMGRILTEGFAKGLRISIDELTHPRK